MANNGFGKTVLSSAILEERREAPVAEALTGRVVELVHPIGDESSRWSP